MFNAPTLWLQERQAYYSFRVIDLLYIILLAVLKKVTPPQFKKSEK